MADTYEGPVCYVGHDHEAADGGMLKGGWHYSVVSTPDGDRPDKPLVLHEDGTYTVVKKGDKSWRENHPDTLTVIAPNGNIGIPQTPEEIAAVRRHLDRIEQEQA